MKNLQVNTNPDIDKVFNNYPEPVRTKMFNLRNLIIDTARGIEGLTKIEETLKWGEPSYITKHGSTIRIDWKPKTPNQYAMYFQCTSKLVPTFKLIFKDVFTFEGTRAIIFQLEDDLPKKALKSCIKAALTYHKVKLLPSLAI